MPALGAVGAVVGGVIGASGSKSAARAQADAANRQAELQKQMYDQTREDQAPWRTVGGNALNELAMRLGIGGYTSEKAPTVQTMDEIRANMMKQYGGGGMTALPQGSVGDGYIMRFVGPDQSTELVPISLSQGGRANAQQIEAAAQAEYQRQQQALKDFQAKQSEASKNPLYGSLLDTFSREDFQTDPGYEFRLGEGQKALESSAAARGGLLSGAAAKALTKYNQNFASNEYQNAYNRFNNDQTNIFNRLAGIAGVGQTATNQLQQAGQNYANQTGNAIQYGGAARGSGYINQANAINGALGGLAGAASNWGGGWGSTPMNWGTAFQYGTTPGSRQTNMLAQQEQGLW